MTRGRGRALPGCEFFEPALEEKGCCPTTGRLGAMPAANFVDRGRIEGLCLGRSGHGAMLLSSPNSQSTVNRLPDLGRKRRHRHAFECGRIGPLSRRRRQKSMYLPGAGGRETDDFAISIDRVCLKQIKVLRIRNQDRVQIRQGTVRDQDRPLIEVLFGRQPLPSLLLSRAHSRYGRRRRRRGA